MDLWPNFFFIILSLKDKYLHGTISFKSFKIFFQGTLRLIAIINICVIFNVRWPYVHVSVLVQFFVQLEETRERVFVAHWHKMISWQNDYINISSRNEHVLPLCIDDRDVRGCPLKERCILLLMIDLCFNLIKWVHKYYQTNQT